MDTIREITPEIRQKLDQLAVLGNELEAKGQLEQAIQVWQQGLELIPEPRQYYGETIRFLVAIGDVLFQVEEYDKAHVYFNDARGNLTGGGYANPFIMLRLGQCCLEIGDEKNAIEYLLRAYMMEGREIFEDEEEKYFLFLQNRVDHIE